MTLTSENIAAIETAPTVTAAPKRRGRPTGVKNGEGVVHKKPAVKKKPVKKPRVRINTDAIVANSQVNKLIVEVERLKEMLSLATDAFKNAELRVEEAENKHKAALIVIGYLERKVFKE